MKSTIIMFRDIGFNYIFAKNNKIIFADGEKDEGNDNGRIIFDLENQIVSTNIVYHSNINKIDRLIEHFKKELNWK
jgi:hypothetical protein